MNGALQPAHCRHAISSLQADDRRHYLSFDERNEEMEGQMNLIRNYRNWRRVRETVNELNRLSNRELADLGINRAEIERVARQGL
jgi:uncharacterized protein YjiS (DUF1127 family)